MKKTAIIAITRHGVALAGRAAGALSGAQIFVPEKFRAEAVQTGKDFQCYLGGTAAQIPALLGDFDAIVAIVSLGAVVRLIAPHLRGKTMDPAVVVLDEAGRFAIPVLSGHLGGANALAGHLALALGATPVLTTASDALQTLAVDLLGHELGWTFEANHAELVHCSAAMVNEAPVALVQESGSPNWWRNHANGRPGPLPDNLRCFSRLEDVDPGDFAAVLWISERSMPKDYAARLSGKCVTYRAEAAPSG